MNTLECQYSKKYTSLTIMQQLFEIKILNRKMTRTTHTLSNLVNPSNESLKNVLELHFVILKLFDARFLQRKDNLLTSTLEKYILSKSLAKLSVKM